MCLVYKLTKGQEIQYLYNCQSCKFNSKSRIHINTYTIKNCLLKLGLSICSFLVLTASKIYSVIPPPPLFFCGSINLFIYLILAWGNSYKDLINS